MTFLFSKSFTPRQYDLMFAIRRGNSDGSFLDLDQLARAFKVSKQAMQFSVRFLIKHGVMRKVTELRQSRHHVCYALTPQAYLFLCAEPDIVLLELLKSSEDE